MTECNFVYTRNNMLTEQNKFLLKRFIIEIVIFAVLLASDLISKDIIMNRMGFELYEQYIVVDGLFAIYPCTNDGASFSIFSGKTEFLIAFTAIVLVAVCVLMVINLIKKPRMSWLFRWSMLLIVSGGVGNLVDRIFCGGEVRDFIQYMFLDKIWQPLFDSNFGVGNVADIYLVLGIFLICVYIVFDYKEGDLGLLKPKLPKNMRPDEVPVEDKADTTLESDAVEDCAACKADEALEEQTNKIETQNIDNSCEDTGKSKHENKSGAMEINADKQS